MKTELIKKEGCVAYFGLSFEKDELSSDVSQAINKYKSSAKINGFRPGKAPEAIVIKTYKDRIKQDVLSKTIEGNLSKVYEELSLKPISEPVLDKLEYELNADLVVEGKVETFPEFEVADYKGINLKRISSDVEDSDIDKALNEVVESHAQFETINDRVAKEDDFLVIDYTVFEGEKEIDKKEGSWVQLSGESALNQEFKKALTGCNAGEDVNFDTVLPEDYPKKELIGKNVSISVTVGEIRNKKLPELNDEFLTKIGGQFKTVDEYKEAVKKYLVVHKKKQQEQNIEDQIHQELLKNCQFDLPPSIIEKQTNSNYENHVSQMRQKGVSESVIKENHDTYWKASYEQALTQIKLEFIKGKISEKEKIEIEKEDIEKSLETQAAEYGMTPSNLEKALKENKQYHYFQNQVRIEKMMNWIKENANISDVKSN